MPPIRREHTGNAAVTQLGGSGLPTGVMSFTVVDAAGWPTGSVGPFVVTIAAGQADEEKVLCSSRAGTTVTVAPGGRGYDGTVDQPHSAGAQAIHSFSASEADEANAHVMASSGVHGAGSALVGVTDAQTLTNKTLTAPTVNNPVVVGGSFDTPIGRRNVIRNGDMGVRQRGNTGFTATDVYTADGWRKYHTGGSHTVTPTLAAASSPLRRDGASFYLASTVASQSAAGDYARLTQRIEGVRTLAGKEVTLSFLAAASAGTPKIGIEISQIFGTGGTPSADVTTAIQAVTLSTSTTRYSVTFTVPDIATKFIGSNGDDFLEVILWLSAGSTWAGNSSNIGIQNATINITDVQLEQGGPTGFERLSQQEQLAWCQRYFVRLAGGTPNVGSGYTGLGAGMNMASNTSRFFVALPVPLRVPASVTLRGTVAIESGGAGTIGATVITAIAGLYHVAGAANIVMIEGATAVAVAVGYPVVVYTGTTSGDGLDFTAEL